MLVSYTDYDVILFIFYLCYIYLTICLRLTKKKPIYIIIYILYFKEYFHMYLDLKIYFLKKLLFNNGEPLKNFHELIITNCNV